MVLPLSRLSLVEPRSLAGALAALRDDPELKPLAGCTDLYVGLHFATEKAARFLDLSPLRALRGFTRVHLKPGAQQTVSFTLKDRDLSQVSPDGMHLVRSGRYGISVGGGQPGTGVQAATGTFEIQGERTLPR